MTSVHQERDVTLLARTQPDGRIAFIWLCGDPTLQSQVRASLRATFPPQGRPHLRRADA